MNERAPGLLDRTLRRFRRAWRRGPLKSEVRPGLPDDDAQRVRGQIDACLGARGGEVSARARAADLGETYLALNSTGRRRFLALLSRSYGLNRDAIEAAIVAHGKARNLTALRQAENRLREVLVPPRVRLLSQFNGLNEGVKFLVDMRAELHALVDRRPYLQRLDRELRELLASWFDVGFLDLERITWGTPAALLEKLIEYEAVHAIQSWDDLKNRLEADRRCFAFFHPRMPDEPLIFVEVALVTGMSGNVQALLDLDAPAVDPERADTAIFYSISNCQPGLAGVSFGNFLIKRVADSLARELPNLKVFATLSPIPGFRRWLDAALAADVELSFTTADRTALAPHGEASTPGATLRALLERPGWHEDPEVEPALEPVLKRLCAHYLLVERGAGRARDRVAHFHLTNGARVERINWMADRSAGGLAQSAGMMVNYRYDLGEVEGNHEAYTGEGRVSAAAAVRKLIKG